MGKMNGTADPQVHTQVSTPTAAPVLACLLGRNRVGKSKTGWALAATWPSDRTLRVWDLDPASAQEDGRTLSWFFPSAIKPDGVGEQARVEFLQSQADDMIGALLDGRPYDVICDFGDVEEMLKRFAGQFSFVKVMEEFGIRVVAIHVIGTEVADLRFLREVETTGVFKPKLAALVMNEALVDPNQRAVDAFREVLASPIVAEFKARGGVGAVMPALIQMPKIDRLVEQHGPLPFQTFAVPSKDRLGFLDARLVKLWLDEKVPAMREKLSAVLP